VAAYLKDTAAILGFYFFFVPWHGGLLYFDSRRGGLSQGYCCPTCSFYFVLWHGIVRRPISRILLPFLVFTFSSSRGTVDFFTSIAGVVTYLKDTAAQLAQFFFGMWRGGVWRPISRILLHHLLMGAWLYSSPPHFAIAVLA
jgi:hypothetical protein